MVKPAEDKDFVQSLERGLSVILAFSDRHPRLSLPELAELTGLSRPTVRRLALTLERLGYMRADGRHYTLTPHVLALGHAYLSSLSLTELAQPFMEEVTRITGHTCSLAALDTEDAVFLSRISAQRVMRTTLTTGTRLPAYATSMGRVLLAGLRDSELDAYLERAAMPRLTARTVTDPAELRRVLMDVRRQGWAVVDQEFEEGVRSFSAPVREAGGRVIASLSMSVPAASVTVEAVRDTLLPVIVEAARAISEQLGAGYHERNRA